MRKKLFKKKRWLRQTLAILMAGQLFGFGIASAEDYVGRITGTPSDLISHPTAGDNSGAEVIYTFAPESNFYLTPAAGVDIDIFNCSVHVSDFYSNNKGVRINPTNSDLKFFAIIHQLSEDNTGSNINNSMSLQPAIYLNNYITNLYFGRHTLTATAITGDVTNDLGLGLPTDIELATYVLGYNINAGNVYFQDSLTAHILAQTGNAVSATSLTRVYAQAIGMNLMNIGGGTAIVYEGNATINVGALAGNVSGGQGDVENYALATGMLLNTSNQEVQFKGPVEINVQAKGGIVTDGTPDLNPTSPATAAYGIALSEEGSAFSYQFLKVDAPLTIKVQTTPSASLEGGTLPTTGNPGAYGLVINSGDNNVVDVNRDLTIEAEILEPQGVTSSSAYLYDSRWAYALYAKGDETNIINVNQNGGSIVRLTGNIFVTDAAGGNIIPYGLPPAKNDYPAINLKLDNENSWWRPVGDIPSGGRLVADFGSGKFEIANGAVLDLAWWSNRNGSSYIAERAMNIFGRAYIYDGAIFRINSDIANNQADIITFENTEAVTGTQYVQVAYDPIISTLEDGETAYSQTRIPVLQFGDYDSASGESYKAFGDIRNMVTGGEYEIDDGAVKYTVLPLIEYDSNLLTTDATAYLIGLTRLHRSGPSETGKGNSDGQLALRNLWYLENSNMLARLGDIRLTEEDAVSGFWVKNWGGRLKSQGAYGRKFSQKYYAYQMGYDRDHRVSKGTYYTGAAVSRVQSSPHFENGGGKSHSITFKAYSSFLGDRGHYTDYVASIGKYRNKYSLVNNLGLSDGTNYGVWGMSLGVEHGYRGELDNNWFYEPQVQLTLGRLNSADHVTVNGSYYQQSRVDMALARAGILIGKHVNTSTDRPGNVYFRTSVMKDFGSRGHLVGDGLEIETAQGLRKTIVELNLGTNLHLSKQNDLHFEITKTFGGDVKKDWQINAVLRTSW